MKAPRIAFVRQRYVYHGGAEQILARTIAALQKEGARITVVTRHWQETGDIQMRICDPFHVGSLWRDWAFARCVCRLLPRLDVDLVQSHERISCCDIYRAGDGVHREWLRQRGRALGGLRRFLIAANPYHRYLLRAEKKLFHSPRLRAVICNSRMVRDEIREHFGIPADKLRVIYNGVDTARFHPELRSHRRAVRGQYAIPEDATLFVFVGAGFVRKGLRYVLEAMAQLPDSAFLLVVGKDKRAPAFVRLARQLGIAARVRFAGAQREAAPFYGAADALVLPTLYDPFPNVIMEAMAAGLPVVTSMKCGAAELIENGKNGFVCDALDNAGLVAAMRSLLDPERRKRIGAAARQTAEPMTLEAMSNELMQLYRELIARP